MKNKILIGALVGLGVMAIGYLLSNKEKNYISVNGEQTSEEDEKEDITVKEKIKAAANRMVNWVITHKDHIEAVSLVLGMIAAGIDVSNKVKAGRNAVAKTPKTKGSSDYLDAEQILQRVRETRHSVVATDDKGFSFIVMPEGGATT